MTTSDGRLTICFNGEIYNYQELRAELERAGAVFATHSDTEVILHLYEREGSDCVKRLRGMFAFALWDERTRTAFLARDPFGIKPLYVHRTRTTLAFASELRALVRSEVFSPSLSAEAVRRFFETGSVPEPRTLLNEAVCLAAGHTMEWREGTFVSSSFWHPRLEGVARLRGDAVAHTRGALIDSVKHHFVSDVPVGVFLSGGIDSTALLALANETGHAGVGAFCIAVDDEAADESSVARRTAAHFGASYHEMRLDAQVARGLFEQFLTHMDQPSIDGLNTFTVSTLAREQGMKVVLSGLGGDELFGGYASFQTIPKMLRWRRWLNCVPGAVAAAGVVLKRSPQGRRMVEFLHSTGTVEDAYASLRGVFSSAEAAALTKWVCGNGSRESQPCERHDRRSVQDHISELELTRYMRNQLLRDSDVMSMARGLELRVPFVDRVLFEAVAGIPAAVRLRRGKRLLTDAVPEIPEWVVNQKKRGFLFPFQKWLGSEWGAAFDEATSGAPVPMPNWYQRWSVFVLKRFVQRMGESA